jgi:predicted nuclease of predicted toxin-antitoxin system
MKFLVDESAELRLASHLVHLGHDVAIVGRDYPFSLKDYQVLAIASHEQRIVVANDKDFGELIFRDHSAHAGVILFRMKDESILGKISRLDDLLAQHVDDLATYSAYVVVSDERIRVRLAG